MDKQYDKRTRKTKRRPESGNTYRFTQNDTKEISNRKTRGHDGILGFTSIPDRLELEMNKCLQRAHVPEWMTKGSTTLIKKDPSKGTAPNNYRSITCLRMMWKILTAQIIAEIYDSLTSCGLFPDEQKECCKGTRGTAELLHIDRHILNESKTRRKNLAMVWIDCKKGICHGSAKLDNKLPQNVQNIIWSHKLYRRNYENL